MILWDLAARACPRPAGRSVASSSLSLGTSVPRQKWQLKKWILEKGRISGQWGHGLLNLTSGFVPALLGIKTSWR